MTQETSPAQSQEIPIRRSARLMLLDPQGRLMLFRYDNGRSEPFWATAGGELVGDEDYRQAAARELQEETGFAATIGPLLRERDDIFAVADQPPAHWFEQYYLVRCENAETPDRAGWTDEEHITIRNSHWWSLEEMRAAPPATFRPEWLPELLQELVEGDTNA